MEDPKESVVRGRGAWKMSEKWVENEWKTGGRRDVKVSRQGQVSISVAKLN